MSDFTTLRERMIDRQIAARGLDDPRLLAAFRAVPREDFIGGDYADYAYQDSPLPIESGQTISQPYIVALTINAAGIKPGDKVLEVGAGSGYAAAVIGQIAGEVIAIERHHELVKLAQKRMRQLGYRNVRVVEGDGTLGWPELAPFDAIVAAASGSHVPQSWIAQLKPGGRIVMPIGEPHAVQSLVKVTKAEDGTLHREDLGGVRFVPLIGKEGFRDGGSEALVRSLPQMMADSAEPLPDIEDPAFSALFDRYADARVVLLGEASHGTSEFYRARAAITRRLVERHGFTIVALEADRPDAATLDRIVRHRGPREGEERAFARFPTWMWRNREFDAFVRWLHGHNEGRQPGEMAGLFGLDLYNLSGSMRAVIDYLEQKDPKLAAEARDRYQCLAPFSRDPAQYGRLAMTSGYAFCRDQVVAMLGELLENRLELVAQDGEEWLDAAANARLVKNAEAYYRVMYEGSADSWNLRDTHMFETLCALLDARGPDAKAVVWAHNAGQTLARGSGDCEDYVIAKMQLLINAGVPATDMFLVIGNDLTLGSAHALLLVRQAGRFWVLDSLSNRILASESYTSFRPIISFGAKGAWIHGYAVGAAPRSINGRRATKPQLAANNNLASVVAKQYRR